MSVWMHYRPNDKADFGVIGNSVELSLVSRIGDEARFAIKFGTPEGRFSWPQIPCCIYRRDTLEVVVELHREHRSAGGPIIGISLDGGSVVVPNAGLCITSYWTQSAGEAVLAGPEGWKFVTLGPQDSIDHEHDVFDWTKIGPRFLREAWHHSEFDRWAAPENFVRFVRDDVLGWRSDPDQTKPQD